MKTPKPHPPLAITPDPNNLNAGERVRAETKDGLPIHCAFTSPPYFAKEHYSEEPTQSWKRYATGAAWREHFLCPMMVLQFNAIKKGSFAVVNIADITLRGKRYPLIQWTIDAGKLAGFEHVETKSLTFPQRLGLEDEDPVSEPLLIFKQSMA